MIHWGVLRTQEHASLLQETKRPCTAARSGDNRKASKPTPKGCNIPERCYYLLHSVPQDLFDKSLARHHEGVLVQRVPPPRKGRVVHVAVPDCNRARKTGCAYRMETAMRNTAPGYALLSFF